MNRLQEGSLLRLKRKNGPDTWVFRWYDESNGTRRYRKTVVGTVERLRTRHDAETAVLSLRRHINAEQKSPETVSVRLTLGVRFQEVVVHSIENWDADVANKKQHRRPNGLSPSCSTDDL